MSVEPIRPEDHKVRNDDGWDRPLQHLATADGNNDGIDFFRGAMHKAALVEAIHQTFERDAEWAAGAKAEADDPALATVRKLMGGMLATGPEDPDTEIDRIARLIVQGEYRRRQEQETK